MAKLVLAFCIFAIFGLTTFTCNTQAATYTVGDSSGWDISSDLDTWTQGKKFVVGDVLMFQYSSSNTVDEVTKESFDTCNTTDAIRIFTNGNTTVPLTKPGMMYFISGNKLYCLGGMKLQVNVAGNQASSPVSSPQAQPQPSSKNNNPGTAIPTSAGLLYGGKDFVVIALLGFATFMLLMIKM